MRDPCRIQTSQPGSGIKGTPVLVFRNWPYNGLSDVPVDCSRHNAVSIAVYVNGTNPSATVSVEGASEAGGAYLPLPDLNASQTVTGNTTFDVIVGCRFVRVRLADITGTFGANQGFTVWVTPYVSPGSARVAASIVVDTLAAIQAKTGALTVQDVLDVSTGGVIKSGQTAFDTGVGYWLEYNAGTPRFSIGNSAGNKLTWDGSALSVNGALVTGAGSSIDGGYIANATITAAKIANATITAQQIANATITGTQIASGTILGSNIASGTITSANIGTGAIVGANIASGTITGVNIQDLSITASEIQDLTITAGKIANATITGAQIANATITGANIAAATIQGSNIAGGTITGSNIAGSTITGANIQAATITGSLIANSTITGSNIVGGTITSDLIAAGTIVGSNIAASTITADKLSVATLAAIQANIGAANISDWLTIGTSGGIYQGTGTPASPTTGLKIYNSGGVGLLEMWGGGVKQVWFGTDGKLYAAGGSIALDASALSVGTNPAQSGYLRMQNAQSINWRNHANTADISALAVNTDDQLMLGTWLNANAQHISNAASLSVGTSSTGPDKGIHVMGPIWGGPYLSVGTTTRAQSGAIRLSNAEWITARNAANTVDVDIVSVNTSNRIALGAAVESLDIGTVTGATTGEVRASTAFTVGTNPASAGVLRVPNNAWLAARNAANTADVNVVSVNPSNRIALGAALESLNVGTATGAATGIVRGSTAAGHNQWAIETTYPGAVAGIQLIANSYTWEWQHRGTFDAPNNRLILFGDGSQRLVITTTGNVLIGTTTDSGYRLDVQGGSTRIGGNVGFYNSAPAAKPTITGSRGGNAALASLLTGLASLGLITNNTTA